MIYHVTLRSMLLGIGLLLLAGHGLGLLFGAATRNWARRFPRSRPEGIVLAATAAIWFVTIISLQPDIGDFTPLVPYLQYGAPLLALLACIYLPEFLSVRALGAVLLLAAEPLIEAGFMHTEWMRLPLVTLAYVWVIAGLFFVGKPYLLRDLIAWATARNERWTGCLLAGTGYGLLLVVLSFLLPA